MNHIRVSPDRLINPDVFGSIAYGQSIGGNPEVTFIPPGKTEAAGLKVTGPEAARLWDRLSLPEDRLERLAAELDEIEERQRRVMHLLGQLEGPARHPKEGAR